LAYPESAGPNELQGHNAAALADIGKALSNSQSASTQLLAGTIYVEAGDLAKAQKMAAALATQSSGEPQADSKIILGLIALKKKDTKEAIKQISAANTLLDTWLGRFELGRAYLEAGSFTDADSQFDQCLKRRGETIELFNGNVPTYAWLPPVYYYRGRAQQGMKSAGFADSYKTYLGIRGQATDDPLLPEIRHQIGQ